MIIHLQTVMLATLILSAFITDIRSMRIPNVITAAGVLAGAVIQTSLAGWTGLAHASMGLAAGFFPLLFLYWLGAVGAGDVKLFAALGALSDPLYALACLMYSLLYAGVFAVAILIVRHNRHYLQRFAASLFHLIWFRDLLQWTEIRNHAQLRFPFMMAVLPAAVTAWIYYEI